ncbi:immunity protein Tsi6 family protein [Zobellia laminariae]|uniref:immunity protein Tsi6 family protein n=1 Tax=Zobellia laminariae TaxID=248906 RepID=UPI0026F47433|nr:immunity protein Tsi6 family protein [Zobellia laminariae]WKX76210.1 immunity protein Tsi6 family protein [Zobellia laminariae]
MTKKEAIKTLEKTIKKSFDIYSDNSKWKPIASTRIQLQYIIEALQNPNNREKLKSLTIGIYAVREFETEHEEFANLIYEVVEIVNLMNKGKL